MFYTSAKNFYCFAFNKPKNGKGPSGNNINKEIKLQK